MLYVLLSYVPRAVPQGDITNWLNMAGMYDITDNILVRAVFFLDSVPVIPNSGGLYDSSGHWLMPTVSVFDVMVAVLLLAVLWSIASRLVGLVAPVSARASDLVAHNGKTLDNWSNRQHHSIKGFSD